MSNTKVHVPVSQNRRSLCKAIEACIAAAPEKQRAALANELEAYFERSPAVYKFLQSAPITEDILDALVVGADARLVVGE